MTLPAEIVRALQLTPGTQRKGAMCADSSILATPQPKRAQRAAALHGAVERNAILVHCDPHTLSIPQHLLQQELLPDKD